MKFLKQAVKALKKLKRYNGAAVCVLLAASRFNPSTLHAQTPVVFPLNQMFGGGAYTKTFTLEAQYSWVTDGSNAWIGANYTVTPTGGTNPVVYLTPNTYLVTFPDATFPWRINVPDTNILQNAIALSTGPVPVFYANPFLPLVNAAGQIITPTNFFGTNVAALIATLNAAGFSPGGGASATNVNFVPGNNTVVVTNGGAYAVNVVGLGNAAFANSNLLSIGGNSATATAVTGPVAASQLTGTQPLSTVNGLVPTNVNSQTFITFSTFLPTPADKVNGVWMFQGTSPTNFFITTSTNQADALYVDPFGNDTRDASHIKWVNNNGNAIYLLSYNTQTNQSAGHCPGIGIATSQDDLHWTFYGYVLLGTNYLDMWSPKFFINATNGLQMSVALSAFSFLSNPTNSFVMDIDVNNYTNFSNLRWVNTFGIDPAGNPEQSSGCYLWFNGFYYYFRTTGSEFTNNALTQNGWVLANGSADANWASAGDAVINFKGEWYWFTTDGEVTVIESPDLEHWTDLSGLAVFSTPFSQGTSPNTAMDNEGTAIVENFATPPPSLYANSITNGEQGVSLGITRPSNGSGLTNLNASQLTSGTVPGAQLPLATVSAFGAVKPDGITVTISAGVISAVSSGSVPSGLVTNNGTAAVQLPVEGNVLASATISNKTLLAMPLNLRPLPGTGTNYLQVNGTNGQPAFSISSNGIATGNGGGLTNTTVLDTNIAESFGGGNGLNVGHGNTFMTSGSYTFGDNNEGGTDSFILGNNAQSGGQYDILLGYNAATLGTISGVAIGYTASANGGHSIAIGENANSEGAEALTMGLSALATNGAVAIGLDADSSGSQNGVAVGNAASAGSLFGTPGTPTGAGNIAIGTSAKAGFASWASNTVEIGPGTAVSNGWFHFLGHALIDTNGVFHGTFSGNGGGLTNIVATNSTTSMLPIYATATTTNYTLPMSDSFFLITLTNQASILWGLPIAGHTFCSVLLSNSTTTPTNVWLNFPGVAASAATTNVLNVPASPGVRMLYLFGNTNYLDAP